jgi:bla regulator protein BlaR1
MIAALENHLWQSTLFACVVALLTLMLRKNRAAVRHWLWLAASVKFLVPFSILVSIVGQVEWRKAPAAAPPQLSVVEQISQPFAPRTPPPLVVSVPTEPSRLPAILFGLWLCGLAAHGLAWWRRWRNVRAALHGASPLYLGLPIRAMSTPSRLEPGVFGVFRPVLVLPEGISERLTPAQFESVLAHELCHVRRRDNLAAVVHMLVEALFWFHPFLWWIGARLVEERERACDEEVLRTATDPQDYAEGIVEVCKLYLKSPLVCVSGVTGANLKKRIEAIMRNDVIRKLNLTKTVVLTVAGIASLAVPIVVGVMNAPLLMGQALPTSVDSGSTSRLEFEVASIRPAGPMNIPGGGGGISEKAGIPGRCVQKLTLDQGRLDIRCYSLGKLMWAWAFGIPPARLVGTAWMGDSPSDWTSGPKFDISAKLPDGASRDQVPAMLQNLLTSRFKLATHREYREQPVYALIAAKGGPTVEPASQNGDTLTAAANPQPSGPMNMNGVAFYGARIPNPGGGGSQIVIMNSPRMGTVRDSDSGSPRYIRRFEAPGITFGGLADLLTIIGIGPEPVIDLTGEKGRHQVVLEMSMAELEALLRDGMRDEIQSAELKAARDGLKKLGLQLVPRKAPIEVLVVDHLEKAPTEN